MPPTASPLKDLRGKELGDQRVFFVASVRSYKEKIPLG